MPLSPKEELELLQLEEEEHQHQLAAKKAPQSPVEASSQPQEDAPSRLESFVRGGAQGASFGLEDEGVGVVGAGVGGLKKLAHGEVPSIDHLKNLYKQYRDIERNNNKKAQEANPITYTGGMLAGGLVVPGIGVAGTLAKDAGAIAKIAHSAGIGAMAGGAGGFGMSEADNASDLVKDSASGAGYGALFGGGIRAIPEGFKAGAQLAKKPLSFVYNQIIKFQPARIIGEATRKGYEGKDLTNLQKQFERLNSAAKEVGELGLTAKKQLSSEYDQLLAKMKESNEKVDLKPFIQKMKSIEEEFRSIKSPEVHSDLDEVGNTVKNYTEGMPQTKQVTEQIPGKAAIPSAEEKMRSELALHKAKLDEMGYNASTDLANATDELGRDVLVPKINYSKVGQEPTIQAAFDEAGNLAPGVSPELASKLKVLKPVVNTPGVPATPGSERIREIVERSGGSPEISQKELFDLQKRLGQQSSFTTSPLKTNEGKAFAGAVDKELGNVVQKSLPGVTAQNTKYAALNNGLKIFGLDDTSAFIKNAKTGELELTPQAMSKIENNIRQAAGEGNPKNSAIAGLKLFMDNLEAAGVKNINKLKNKLADVGEDFDLAKDIAGKSLYTGGSNIPLLNTKNAAFFGNTLGRGVNAVAKGADKILDPSISTVARQQDNSQESKNTNLSQDVYSLQPEQLNILGEQLSKNGFGEMGTALNQAVKGNDRTKTNAILFSLMQNPNARKLIRGDGVK